jgi:hypothetical protein
MIRIKPLTLDDGTRILVEVEEARMPAADGGGGSGQGSGAMDQLRASIAGIARGVHDSLSADALGGRPPKEWTMEVSIGFKGEDQPIPVIVTGAATGSIKITARWKQQD